MINNTDTETDIVYSTRIRLARNIKGIPYPRRMSLKDAERVTESVTDALKGSAIGDSLTLIRMRDTDDITKKALIECHLISPNLAYSDIGSVIISKDKKISIMINEEDHLRIQVFEDGLDTDTAYENAQRIASLLSEKITFDYDEEFGYLTSCLTNTGSGLRASCMLHLPAITISKNVNPLLKWAANLGMTIRGLYGEGTESEGALFQLSNQITLGVSDREILERFTNSANQLVNEERRITSELFEGNESALKDKVLRSLGILKYAYKVSSTEAMNLISNVCFGVNAGIIKGIDNQKLRNALFTTMPATLAESIENGQQGEARDVYRAEKIQKALVERNE